jgi:hypothetical protein
MIWPTRHPASFHREEADDVPPQAPTTPGRALQKPARPMVGWFRGSVRPADAGHLRRHHASVNPHGLNNPAPSIDWRPLLSRLSLAIIATLAGLGAAEAQHAPASPNTGLRLMWTGYAFQVRRESRDGLAVSELSGRSVQGQTVKFVH